jgi:hypothetical protein
MAWIEKLEGKTGSTYRVAWRDPSGRRNSRTVKRHRDAVELKHNVEGELDRGEALDPNRAKVPFRKLFRHFIETAVLQPTTVALYAGTYGRYLERAYISFP